MSTLIVSETLRCSSRSSAGILSSISRLGEIFDRDSRVLLFALSSNAPDLSQTVDQLRHLATQSVGCLSAPEHPDVVSCSVALLDARMATSFRSDIPGRVPAQVGRWHSPKRMQERTTLVDESTPLDFGVDWGEVWSKGVSTPPLPQELQKLQLVCSPNNDRRYPLMTLTQSEANSVICFSDDAPEGLLNSLRQLPHSDKVCSSLVSDSAAYRVLDGNDMLVHAFHNWTSLYHVLQRQSVFWWCGRGCNLRDATQLSRRFAYEP